MKEYVPTLNFREWQKLTYLYRNQKNTNTHTHMHTHAHKYNIQNILQRNMHAYTHHDDVCIL